MASVLTVFQEVELFEEASTALPILPQLSADRADDGTSSPPTAIVAMLAPKSDLPPYRSRAANASVWEPLLS